MCVVVVVLCVLLLSYVYLLYYECIAVFTSGAGPLARSQYSEGPATGHLDTGFSWFPCAYKQMLRWFPRFQVATTYYYMGRRELRTRLCCGNIREGYHLEYLGIGGMIILKMGLQEIGSGSLE